MAKTKPCSACGEWVSTEASVCPHCGHLTMGGRKEEFISGLWRLIAWGVAVLILLFILWVIAY